MNEFLIGLQNSSNTQRTTVHVTASDWYTAMEKVMSVHLWAGFCEVLAQNGVKFDRSGVFNI